ncbi:MAG: hypothetical protein ACC619_11005 [Paracoccaceae bacterium]
MEDKGEADHAGHDHLGHAGHATAEAVGGIEPQFMSVVDLTTRQPRRSDGLQVD